MKSCCFICCLVIRSNHFVGLQQMQYHNHGAVMPTKKLAHKINVCIALMCWFLDYSIFIKLINIHVVFNFIFSPFHVDMCPPMSINCWWLNYVLVVQNMFVQFVVFVHCIFIGEKKMYHIVAGKKEFNLNDTMSKLPLGRMKSCQIEGKMHKKGKKCL